MARKCGNCGELGHNRATCPNPPKGLEKKEIQVEGTAGDVGGSPQISPPAVPPMPDAPMSKKEEELIGLIGLNATLKLKELGLIEKVSIETLSKSNIEIVDGRYGEPYKVEYAGKTDKISRIIVNSNMTLGDSVSKFSPDQMGDALSVFLNERLQKQISTDSKGERVKFLYEIQKHMDSLSKAFGFDDQRQLEAFFAAWLMKDSTCRLTGIPGTGKTTVIEAAATLLANSYGFNSLTRTFLNTEQYKNYKKGQEVVPIIFPNGQKYALDYGYNESLRSLWENWRFSEWSSKSKTSGSYLYDVRYLRRVRGSKKKESLNPNTFADVLFAKLKATQGKDELGNTKTNYTIKSTPVDEITLSGLFKNGSLPDAIKKTKKGTDTILQYQGKDLYKDTGANEGYYLREFLIDYFYDSRLDDENVGMDLISKEMLEEIGIAKIDYDKRAEEILYGIEIRQETSDNPVTGKTVSEYKFDPSPRPIVTQPIKFFNEANRSGSGVEDAVLGLIAEKTVEYRGQTFKSPSFVAWMDTNPHQKGNDLAFVDRIDMELYFGTLNLGSRFNALTERYSQRKGSDPKLQLVNKISEGVIKPMKFKDLRTVWGLTNGIFFNASGKPDSEGGALLDISLLSVLFTQRYMPKQDKVKVNYNNNETEHTYSDASHTFFTPLVDISRTTNLSYEKQHEVDLNKYLGKDKAQAPALIERMLGFRFTNSLIKMTRALAFLRGKDYVTRQEVIDALPFTVGHRLGPAREGEDPKGRDIGINRDAMTLTNEQEWIKELILEGYVLKKTNTLMGAASEVTLFDDWDSFMKKCKNTIEANDELWIYEKEILNSMKQAVVSGTGITPVHYHIAVMIIENVRNSKIYQDKYKTLFNRISRPQAVAGDEDMDSLMKAKQISSSKTLYQYYNVRGDIINDTYLFADDKMRLLDLINSKIEGFAGVKMPSEASFKGSIYPTANSNYDKMCAEYSSHGFGDLTKYVWNSYNDGLGAWGFLASNGKNKTPQITLGQDLLGKKDYIYEANQELAIVGGFYQVENSSDFVMPVEFVRKLDSMVEALSDDILQGTSYVYASSGVPNAIKEKIKLNTFKENITTAIKNYYCKDATQTVDLKNGLFACFEVKHQNDKNYIKNTLVSQGNDNLLLWFRLHRRSENTMKLNQIDYLALEIGITSKLAKAVKPKVNNELKTNPDGTQYEVFSVYSYIDVGIEMLAKDKYNPFPLYIDSGNLTEMDYGYYTNTILNAITRK